MRLISRPRQSVLRRIYAVDSTVVPAGHTINVPMIVALSSLLQTSGDWAVEPRSLGTRILAARTLMRDEGRQSAVQVMNVGERDFVLRQGVYREAEQVTTVDSGEKNARQPEGEGVLSEEAVVLTARPAEETDLLESRDDAQLQVVIDHLPLGLEPEQRTAGEQFIRDHAGLFEIRIRYRKAEPGSTCNQYWNAQTVQTITATSSTGSPRDHR